MEYNISINQSAIIQPVLHQFDQFTFNQIGIQCRSMILQLIIISILFLIIKFINNRFKQFNDTYNFLVEKILLLFIIFSIYNFIGLYTFFILDWNLILINIVMGVFFAVFFGIYVYLTFEKITDEERNKFQLQISEIKEKIKKELKL